MKKISLFSVSVIVGLLFTSCSDDDVPPIENEEEVIDQVTLTFNETGAQPLVFMATDPDGAGAQDFQIPEIMLVPNTTYSLSITLANAANSEDITNEVREEGVEHMFFFAWTEGLFSEPSGNGNIDNREDAVSYEDEDTNGLPIGLTTNWTTGDAVSGTFTLLLKHQPDVKTSTSSASDGETDIELEWDISIR